MRIYLHIGPDGPSSDRIQRILDAKRGRLKDEGVLYARSPGTRNHTRLFMAVTDADRPDVLRFNRGFMLAGKQAALREDVTRQLAQEAEREGAHSLILSAHQLGTSLSNRTELERLRDMLAPISSDIRILAWLDEPARALVARYGAQVLDGRARALDLELGLLDAPDFRSAALETWPDTAPLAGLFPEVQGANFWLDYKRLQDEWEAVFGTGSVQFRSINRDRLWSEEATTDLCEAFGIKAQIGKAEAEDLPRLPAAPWLTRARLFNDAVLRLLDRQDILLPRALWRRFLGEIKVPGGAILAGALSELSMRFEADIADLCAAHPGMDPADMEADPICGDWQEACPTRGYRATQYLMAFRWRIAQGDKEERAARAAELAHLHGASVPEPETPPLTDAAQEVMPPQAKQNFARLHGSAYAPHNRLGRVNEEDLAAAFAPAPRRVLPQGSTGNVIVGCMKNEGPYILEWIAYHRAVGFDNFLIYTNDCSDGTVEILDRLDALGIVHHRDNNGWKGKSPQQHALDAALQEDVIRQADWIAHIDVDEFVNIRCGNGTLADVFDRVPDATNVAMTWRLFGHNGVRRFQDRFVIEQFDTCAPKYCPKPHTVWGFKTMFRNIGAYEKISCHRPNKLAEGFEDKVKWVNGSGHDMTEAAIRNGWRSSKRTIGYDLIQLNHYALRSAESFLIKRQRGRALHVDRNIGLNYWIRMDWSVHRDITIKRNIPRVRAEYDRLMRDDILRAAHHRALEWHRAKAAELHGMPEFEDLYRQALALELTETERVAYALALDMET
ncbi:glycosyltransferase family 2 protein [Mameliella sediminis]|uniref:glycosyltransferase family 2 protein n=1 Tax=Mameliella sediminis TaxID=2836866 RepID=UPI001C495F6F|nr:glycosyltransferase family 2 protein [Mameliella sediminis]MBV7392871.1 glycosyltransferase family 2 protein [Mameliella sediminis]